MLSAHQTICAREVSSSVLISKCVFFCISGDSPRFAEILSVGLFHLTVLLTSEEPLTLQEMEVRVPCKRLDWLCIPEVFAEGGCIIC